jgi:hypothetical protein
VIENLINKLFANFSSSKDSGNDKKDSGDDKKGPAKASK